MNQISPIRLGIITILILAFSNCQTKGLNHNLIAFSPDRSAFIYTVWGSEEIILKNEKEEKKISLKKQGCLIGHANKLFLLTDNTTAIMTGTEANMAFDLFGHAGSHVSANCIIDFNQGVVSDLSKKTPQSVSTVKSQLYQGYKTKNIYLWKQFPDSNTYFVDVLSGDFQKHQRINLDPSHDKNYYNRCAPFEEEGRFLFYCTSSLIYKNRPLVVGYASPLPDKDLSKTLTLKKEESTLVENTETISIDNIKVSSDGKTIVVWNSSLLFSKQSPLDEYKNSIYILKTNPLQLVTEKTWIALESISDIEFFQDGRFLLLTNQSDKNDRTQGGSEIFILDETGEKKTSCGEKKLRYGKLFLKQDQKHYWLSFSVESFLETCSDL